MINLAPRIFSHIVSARYAASVSGGHHPRFVTANHHGQMSTGSRIGVWPTSRSVARKLGVRHFVSGEPCPRGHVGLRVTKTGNCLTCKRESDREAGLARLAAFGDAVGPSLRQEIDRRYRVGHRDERNAKKRETRAFDRFMLGLEVAD